ncbi:MAG: hypothetical protein ACFFFH_09075 [Candidatus Thorarchaeota archaeon]
MRQKFTLILILTILVPIYVNSILVAHFHNRIAVTGLKTNKLSLNKNIIKKAKIQWTTTFGGDASDELYSGIQTIDGGFVLTGCTTNHESAPLGHDGFLVKINTPAALSTESSLPNITTQTDTVRYESFLALIPICLLFWIFHKKR